MFSYSSLESKNVLSYLISYLVIFLFGLFYYPNDVYADGACGSFNPKNHLSDYPKKSWSYWGNSEFGGLNQHSMSELTTRLSELDTTSMVVITGGKIAYEYGDSSVVSYVASVRKSILAILYGIYIDRNAINLDLTLAELNIDDHLQLTEQEKQATNRHLLISSSGVYHPASNSGDNLPQAPERGTKLPGRYFLYSNWDFNAAGTAFETQTGIGIFEALYKDLALPLLFEDFELSKHRKGGNLTRSIHPSYHMHLSTRDKARIGLLMLRKGRWHDQQIVTSSRIEEITSTQVPVSDLNPNYLKKGPFGFGQMWWVWDGEYAEGPLSGAYTASGAFGQYITIIPQFDMVISHKTEFGDNRRVRSREYLNVIDFVLGAYCGQST